MNTYRVVITFEHGESPVMDDDTYIVNATRWLHEDVGDVDEFHEVETSTWQGEFCVEYLLQLSEEQAEKAKSSDRIEHIRKVDDRNH